MGNLIEYEPNLVFSFEIKKCSVHISNKNSILIITKAQIYQTNLEFIIM